MDLSLGTLSLEKLQPPLLGETEGPGTEALLSAGRLMRALLQVVLISPRLG